LTGKRGCDGQLPTVLVLVASAAIVVLGTALVWRPRRFVDPYEAVLRWTFGPRRDPTDEMSNLLALVRLSGIGLLLLAARLLWSALAA
jgi:hypothetical protein